MPSSFLVDVFFYFRTVQLKFSVVCTKLTVIVRDEGGRTERCNSCVLQSVCYCWPTTASRWGGVVTRGRGRQSVRYGVLRGKPQSTDRFPSSGWVRRSWEQAGRQGRAPRPAAHLPGPDSSRTMWCGARWPVAIGQSNEEACYLLRLWSILVSQCASCSITSATLTTVRLRTIHVRVIQWITLSLYDFRGIKTRTCVSIVAHCRYTIGLSELGYNGHQLSTMNPPTSQRNEWSSDE